MGTVYPIGGRQGDPDEGHGTFFTTRSPGRCSSGGDECGLDPENEVEVQRAVNALVEGRTVVVIAHKLRTTQKSCRLNRETGL